LRETTKHYCAAVTCPGYSYRASERAHPCPVGETPEMIRAAFRAMLARAEKAEADAARYRKDHEAMEALRSDPYAETRLLFSPILRTWTCHHRIVDGGSYADPADAILAATSQGKRK